MLKDLALALLRFAKKALVGTTAWFVSLFIILILGTVFQLPDRSPVVSTAYSLIAVFIPIITGIILFLKAGSSSDTPISYYSQEFLSTHTEVREIRTKVVGVSFKNEDGSSRQEILSLCKEGHAIQLLPFRYQGDPAYRVITQYGQIGNLSADDAALLDEFYSGYVIIGNISKITGGTNGHYYGCNIILRIYQEKSAS